MGTISSNPIVGCFVAILGLAVGSFLNVVIYRLPRKKSLITPRSSCPDCGVTIRWHLNVPVLSYLILRGRCRHCGSKISLYYPLVEAVTAALFWLFYWRYGLTVSAAGFWLLSAALVVVFFIDLEWGIIPDVVTLPGIALGLVFSLVSGHLEVTSSALGILAGGGTFFALGLLGRAIFKKESLGGGDIKLAAMLGAFIGPLRVFLVFAFSALLGLLTSLVVLCFSARFRRERILPFGPFLVLAALFIIFCGQELINWYSEHFLAR